MAVIAAFQALPQSVRATLFMLGAMGCFTSMGVFIRLSAAELNALEVVFFRNFLALFWLSPWIWRQGITGLRTSRFGLYSLRSGLNLIGMIAGFTALTLIPLAEATALSFTAPLFATIGAVLVLGEVIRARRVAALVAGFAGMLIVIRPGIEAVSFGAALALTNALMIALTALVVKKLTATERPSAIVVWMALLQTPFSLIPALFVWQWPSPTALFWLFCLAGAGTIGHLMWTRACAMAEISQLQPMEFVKLPLIAALGFLLFGEVPTLWIWLGGAVIFASTVYITHREAQLARRRIAAEERTLP